MTMKNRLSFVFTALALLVLAGSAQAQFALTTNKQDYQGNEPLVVGVKLTNASTGPISYSLLNDGLPASIQYRLQRFNPDNSQHRLSFDVRVNGIRFYKARYITFDNVSSGESGNIGPMKSLSIGGTNGWGVPVDLLHGTDSRAPRGTRIITEENEEILLDFSDQITILSDGVYQLSAFARNLTINGYLYDPSTTGVLADEKLINISKPKEEDPPVRSPSRR